ncbi:replication-relaxation family protein [Embleya sp. NPDC127516]|uniref:replication-relaxation family protein n=1 Tax=Embleya sp. NPDC127516 TaxID=3363990 RepID=UPI0037F91085
MSTDPVTRTTASTDLWDAYAAATSAPPPRPTAPAAAPPATSTASLVSTVGVTVAQGVLLSLASIRVATTAQLHRFVNPHAASADVVRREASALRERGLVDRVRVGNSMVWHLTSAGRTAVDDSGMTPPRPHAATGRKALDSALVDHALAVTATAAACVRHGLGPVTDWQVEIAHPFDKHNPIADAVVTTNTSGHLVEIDRNTESVPVLTRKLRDWTRWAAHRVHVGPRHLIGSTRPAWDARYTTRPDLWLVLDNRPPGDLPAIAAELRRELFNARAVHDSLPIRVTHLQPLIAHGPRARIWVRIW